jgi:hypothetical protein
MPTLTQGLKMVGTICRRETTLDEAANRNAWKTLPIPAEREHFQLPLLFSDAEGERMRLGHIPEDMDDKWFIFFERDGSIFTVAGRAPASTECGSTGLQMECA